MVVALEGGDQAAPPLPRTLDQSQAAAMIQVNRAAPTRVEARSPRILYTKCTLQLPVKGVNTTSTFRRYHSDDHCCGYRLDPACWLSCRVYRLGLLTSRESFIK